MKEQPNKLPQGFEDVQDETTLPEGFESVDSSKKKDDSEVGSSESSPSGSQSQSVKRFKYSTGIPNFLIDQANAAYDKNPAAFDEKINQEKEKYNEGIRKSKSKAKEIVDTKYSKGVDESNADQFAVDINEAISAPATDASNLPPEEFTTEKNVARLNLETPLTDDQKEKVADFAGKYVSVKPKIDELTKKVEMNPDDASSRVELGDALNYIGDTGGALSLYTSATALDSKDNWKALNGIGSVYLQDGQPEAAKAVFTDAIKQNEKNVFARQNKAYIDSKMGNYEESNKELDFLIANSPKSPDRNVSVNDWAYAARSFNKEKLGDAAGAKADEASYKISYWWNNIEDIAAQAQAKDDEKLKGQQQYMRGIADAMESPFKLFGDATLGAVEGVKHGAEVIGEGAKKFDTGTTKDDFTGALQVVSGALDAAFSGAMALNPEINTTFAALPENVNKALMEPINTLGGLTEEDLANMSENGRTANKLLNTVASFVPLGMVHSAVKGVTAPRVKTYEYKGKRYIIPANTDKFIERLQSVGADDVKLTNEIMSEIPKSLTNKQKIDLIPHLVERRDLVSQLDKTNEALQPVVKKKISEVDEEIKKIIEPSIRKTDESTDGVKPKEDATSDGASAEEASKEQGVNGETPESIRVRNDDENRVETKPKEVVFNEPNPETSQIAESYKKKYGINTEPGEAFPVIDETQSRKIADAYEEMKHDPNDPKVRSAYKALSKEVVDQHNAMTEAGYKVELYEGKGEPYKNSTEMAIDVRDNKHLYVLPTEKGFGEGETLSNNPLLADSGIKDANGKPMVVNDVFRAVHDFFGHTERGNQFGAIGEENAWDVHSRMFSPEARRAMTTETRGQNSWVNFGKHMRDELGNIKKVPPTDRPFAPQKTGLLPDEFSNLSKREIAKERLDQARIVFKKAGGLSSGGFESLPEFVELVKAYVNYGIETAKEAWSEFKKDFPEHKVSEEDFAKAFEKATKAPVQRTTPEQKSINETTGVKKPVEEVVTDKASQLKNQIRAEVKAAKEGFIAGRKSATADIKLKSEEVQALKDKVIAQLDAAKKGGFLQGEVPHRTLLTAIKKFNKVKTEKSYDRAVQYLDRVLGDKLYAEKISDVRKQKAYIKSKLRNNKNTFGNKTDAVREIMAIDETNLDRNHLDLYHDTLAALNQKKVPNVRLLNKFAADIKKHFESKLEEEIGGEKEFNEAATTAKVNELIDKLYETKIETVEDVVAMKRNMSALKKNAQILLDEGKITPSQFEEMIPRLDGDRVLDKELKAQVDEFTTKSIEEGKSYQPEVDMSNFSSVERDYIKALFKADTESIKNLGVEAADTYNKLAEQLSNGFFSPKVYDMVHDIEIRKTADQIATEVDKAISERPSNVMNRDRSSDTARDILERITKIPKALIDKALGMGKRNTYFRHVVSKISSAMADQTRDIIAANKKLHDSGKRLSDTSKNKVGIILKQLDYQSNIENFSELGIEQQDAMRFLLSSKREDFSGTGSELSRIEKAYKQLPKNADGNLDVTRAIESLSDKEKKYFDTINEINSRDLEAKIKSATEKRGKVYTPQTDYFKRVTRDKSTKYDKMDSPEEIVGAMSRRMSTKAGSTNSRNSPLLWTEVNPDVVMSKAIREANTDYHLSSPVRIAMNSLYDAASKTEGEGKNILHALGDETKAALVSELNKRKTLDETADVIDTILRGSRNLVLSSPTRIPQEIIPNTLKYLLSEANGKSAIDYTKSIFGVDRKAYDKLMQEEGSGVQFKGSRFSVEQGQTGKEGFGSKLASAVSSFSDALTARGVWTAEFNKHFKESTGQEFSPDAYMNNPSYGQMFEKDIHEAAITAEQKSEQISGSQQNFTASTKIQQFAWSKKLSEKGTTSAKIFGWMQHYNMFEQRTFYENMRDAISGENEGRGHAARYLSGLVTANLAFAATSYFMGNYVKSLFSDEDPTAADIMGKMGTTEGASQIGTGAMLSLLIGGYSNSIKPLVGAALGLYGRYVDPKDKVTKENLEAINSAFKDYQKIHPIDLGSGFKATKARDLLANIPAVGMYASAIWDGISDGVVDLYKKIEENGIDGLTEDEKALWNISIMINTLLSLSNHTQYPGMALTNKYLKSEAIDAGREEAAQKKAQQDAIKLYKKEEKSAPTSKRRRSRI